MFESPCPECKSSGKCKECHGDGQGLLAFSSCSHCDGSGNCQACGGSGNDPTPHFLGFEAFLPKPPAKKKSVW